MCELHRAKRIANDFNLEGKPITKIILLAGIPLNMSVRIKMIL